jgi:hypothetical protein
MKKHVTDEKHKNIVRRTIKANDVLLATYCLRASKQATKAFHLLYQRGQLLQAPNMVSNPRLH